METTKPSPASAVNSSFFMIDIGDKAITRRIAIAQGKITLAPDAYLAIKSGTNPKGNVLALAEIAGIMATKRTADLIPLCHPLSIEKASIHFDLIDVEHSVRVSCEVATSAQTGVEMEALMGVNGALLAIYDLSKAVNPVITLGEIRLNRKEGGKSGVWIHPDAAKTGDQFSMSEKPLQGVRAAVITISDRVSQGTAQDRSGPRAHEILRKLGSEITESAMIPDEKEKIQAAIRHAIQSSRSQLVITTGGTGLSPRDVTPEAIRALGGREVPGLGELLRSDGSKHITTAWLSRSLAVQLDGALVIALPGSTGAVQEGLEALEHLIPHALTISKGANHA